MTPFAAILAGGSGTRFWPASTLDVPKQMLPLTGGEPLLRETVARLEGLVPPEQTLVVTAERYADQVRALLPELPPDNVLGEPRPRNTAAACALAAHFVDRRDPDAVLLTLPSDHVAEPAEALREALAAGATRAAESGHLLTLGLEPDRPATGYGWIQLGEKLAASAGHPVHRVARFVEKPDRAEAEVLLARGGHLWNLGMFAWRPRVLIDELARHLPQVAEPMAAAAPHLGGPGQAAALASAFDDCLSISVDYGILEKSALVECLPCRFKWDDLGSFAALRRHLEPDAKGNVSVGAVLAMDAQGCTTWADSEHLVALLGVEDLIVVHAHGATLVAPRSRAEDVKRLVALLDENGLAAFA